MKLAILANGYLLDETSSINGSLVQLHNLAQGFNKNGIEVHYIATTKDTTKNSYEVENGIHFHWIHSKRGVLEWKRIMPLYKKTLKIISPDVLYVRGRNTLQYVAGNYVKRNDKVYVWGTNGDDSAQFWKHIKRLKVSKKSIARKMLLFPLKALEDSYINKGMMMADQVVNQSKEQQYSTEKSMSKKGVVLSSYFFLPLQKTILKENLILWFANLSKAKQPELFIEIIKKIDSKNWKVILAGGSHIDTYEKSIRELAEKTFIKTTGKVDFKDSFQYYQQGKIYINTSKPDADGLPNAYIQSWLSGAIVLSLHHNPNKWMETHNIGFCSNGNIDELALKLQELIGNPQLLSRMSDNAMSFAKQQFSNDSIINSYINLFEGNA